MSSTITNPFSTVFATLQADAKASLLGLATQTHANIAANPTTQTVAAQGALLALSAPTLLPALETDTIKALNDAFLASFTSVLTAPVPVAPVVPNAEPSSSSASGTSTTA